MSLYERIIESRFNGSSLFERAAGVGAPFQGAIPQAKAVGQNSADRAIGPNSAMLPGSSDSGFAEPMNNPLPGNMDPRSAVAAAGTRWQNKRLTRNRGDAIKSPSPPPSLTQRSGGAEPASPPQAGRPGAGPQYKPAPKPPVNLP